MPLLLVYWLSRLYGDSDTGDEELNPSGPTFQTCPFRFTQDINVVYRKQCVAIAFYKPRKELVEQFVDSKCNPFQEFQLLLGKSSGGFGLHSSPHTCMAASLASSIEYAKYKLKSIREACDNPRAWLTQLLQDNNQNSSYVKAIIHEALRFKNSHGDPTSKPAPHFWTTSDNRVQA